MSSSQNPFSHASRNNTTAHGRTSSPRGGPFHRSPWGGSPADMMDQPFTDEMRDLQARGKDPYAGDASDGSDLSPERLPGGGRMAPHHPHHHPHHHHHAQHHHSHHHHRAASSRQPKEPFTKTERRDWAETVLDNPELLMMYAQSSGATVPATRFRFKKIMCGLDDEEEDDDDDDEPIPEISGPRASYNHQQQQQKYHGQGGQPLRMTAAQQQQRGRGEGGSRSGRR